MFQPIVAIIRYTFFYIHPLFISAIPPYTGQYFWVGPTQPFVQASSLTLHTRAGHENTKNTHHTLIGQTHNWNINTRL
jgi:hypothetical protein